MDKEYIRKLDKMTMAELGEEAKKYFNGTAPKATEQYATDCISFKEEGFCKSTTRTDCKGCSIYKTKG